MKNIYVIISLVLVFFMLLMPLLSLKGSAAAENGENVLQTMGGGLKNREKEETIKVKNTESGKIEEISATDYVIGVLSAEMSPDNHEEALKAQAVAAYSFLLVRKEENKAEEYDITDSYLTDQHYINEEKQNEKWGEKAALTREKLTKIVKSVSGEYLSYGGSAALALYHSVSGGKTENAADVFGKEYPYLISRESIGDLFANGYESRYETTKPEFCEKLSIEESELGSLFVSHRENGYVKEVTFNEKSFTGREIRTTFSLRSANFDITVSGEKVIFTVRGYGHGVGMSQAGAEYLARQGGTYKEILLWYYSGCTIEKSA